MNLIFGVYNSYQSLKTEKGGLYYFLKSLRKYNTNCKVIIVCETKYIFPELRQIADEMNCQIYSNFNLNKRQMMFYRFAIYNKYLDEMSVEERGEITRILLSDLNDIIFQADPFSIDFKDKQELYCAAERNIISDRTNSSSSLNYFWIRQADCLLSDINYSFFIDKPVICAGTVLATYQGIINYLTFYIKVQECCNFTINDQALLNIYVYQYLYQKNEIFKNNPDMFNYHRSNILTLDKIVFKNLGLDSQDGSIINQLSNKYTIIHQIDRCNQPYMLNLIE